MKEDIQNEIAELSIKREKALSNFNISCVSNLTQKRNNLKQQAEEELELNEDNNMSAFIETGALDNCANGTASYGEICVGCNCCGRFDDDEGINLTDEQKAERVNAWWKGMEEPKQICTICGNEEISHKDNFCKICGKRVEKVGGDISDGNENIKRQTFISQIPKDLSEKDKNKIVTLYDKFKEEDNR